MIEMTSIVSGSLPSRFDFAPSLFSLLPTMWHKRQRRRDPEAPAGRRLREGLLDLYGSCEASAEQTQELIEDAGAFAQDMGRDDMQDLWRRQTAGNARNVARDLRRRLLRRSQWPSLYVFHARLWNTKEKELQVQQIAMLLPHELLHVIHEESSFDVLTATAGLDPPNLARHAQIYEAIGSPFVAVSLWGDGVPFSWDRKRSADIWSMSMPGMGQKVHRDLRLTLTALPHEKVVRETQDDIMRVIAWSFSSLALGVFPSRRHDGSEWHPSDHWRQARAGQDLIHAAVIEIKGENGAMTLSLTQAHLCDTPSCNVSHDDCAIPHENKHESDNAGRSRNPWVTKFHERLRC